MQKALPLALLFAAATAAHAAEPAFPTRPIRLVVSTSAGSGVDFFARTPAQPLTELEKQQVIVQNRPGAGGLIGASTIAQAYGERVKSEHATYRKLIAESGLEAQ